MQGGNLENITPENQVPTSDAPRVVNINEGAKDGQNKCPKCGSTDITLNPSNGKLKCDFCRHEFDPVLAQGLESDLTKLEGQVVASGATDIVADTNDVITLKCTSCGAEVVVDTSASTQARCHWCRNTLSINNQVPNGAIPDVVLPFNITKDVAKKAIEEFVGKRKFFAHPKFKEEFTTENVMGVYFPYMVVDINSHAKLIGRGEHLVRQYSVKHGDSYTTYYDADLYTVEREFDLTINGLTVESNSDRLNSNSADKTNNIINSIMPFDIENCVKYDSNYIKGYTSEKRDANVSELSELVNAQAKDIARFAANDSLEFYDRGVAWSGEAFDVKGQQWKAAYLPVWLYSYQEVNGDKKILHYVAVNARTKETMGSVPIHMPKLILVSVIVEFFGGFLWLSIDWDYSFIFLAGGIAFFIFMYNAYRNRSARHNYETETKREVIGLIKKDQYIERRTKLSNSMMNGANNKKVTSSILATKVASSISARTDGVSNNENK